MMLRFLLSMFIMLQGQMVICADAPGAPGPVATGPHFFQYSKRLGGYDFVSQQVNATYPKAYMDAEKYAGTSDARINQYILQPLEYKSLPTVNFEFQCPGHSFLVGVFSNGYDGSGPYKLQTSGIPLRTLPSDRSFFFRCAFLDDPAGNPLKRGECVKAKEPDFMGGGTKSTTCAKDSYLVGMDSSFKDGIRTATSNCCPLQDAQQKPFQTGTCQEKVVDPVGSKTFAFSCPMNSVLMSIKTEYLDTDYRYTFRCCTAFQ